MIEGSRTGFRARRRPRLRIAAEAGGAGAMRTGERLLISADAGGGGALATALAIASNAGGAGRLNQKLLIASDAGGAGFVSGDAVEPTYANGFRHYLEFLIPKENVKGGAALADWLGSIDETFTELRTIANGGLVANASGFDLRLELADGTVIPYARLDWSATTGRFVARLRQASLPAAVDTAARLYFGKTVVADEANPGSAYAACTMAPNLRTGADLTGLSRTFTPTAITSGSLAGFAATFNGTSSKLVRTDPVELDDLSAVTVQALVQLTTAGLSAPILMVGPTSGTNLGIVFRFDGTTGRLIFNLVTTGGDTRVESPDGVMPAVGVPLLVAARWASGQAPTLYIGGEIVTPGNTPTVVSGTVTATLGAGAEAVIGYNRLTSVYFPGQIADLQVSARVLSEGHLQAQELAHLTPRDFYGVGSLNSAATANRSPVAVPINATATVGVLSEVDPAARALEPDGDTKTLSALTGSGGGTSAIVGGRAQFTPTATGTYRRQATVRDPGLKSSTAPIIWLVSAAPPPNTEWPTGLPETAVATTRDQAIALYNGLSAATGGVVRVAHNVNLGGLALNRNAASAAKPFVIAIQGSTPVTNSAYFSGGTTISGTHNMIWGVRAMAQTINMTAAATGSRVRRVLFTGWGGPNNASAQMAMNGTGQLVEYCEFGPNRHRGVRMSPTSRRCKMLHCYVHDFGPNPPFENEQNGNDPIHSGDGRADYNTPTSSADRNEVGWCYFVNCNQENQESECPSIKSAYFYLHDCHMHNAKDPTLRFSHSSRVERVNCTGTSRMVVQGRDHVLNSVWVADTRGIEIFAGNWDSALAGLPPGGTGGGGGSILPSALRTKLIGCKGKIQIGYIWGKPGNGSTVPDVNIRALGTIIEEHQGTLNVVNVQPSPNDWMIVATASEAISTPPTYTATSQGLFADL
jgi:hypothetical protein